MKLDNIKTIGIVLRPSSPQLKEVFFDLKSLIESQEMAVMIESTSADMIGVLGQSFEKICNEADVIMSIGGDGTLLSVVRRSFSYDIAVVGVYAGKLGFLADIKLENLKEFIPKLKTGRFKIDSRAMLEATIETKERNERVIAFNDIVLTRPSISKMVHLEMRVDNRAFNTYYGDGVIISTPTGSTAYNLSSGGPIVMPHTEVFALTPICSHSLTQRPVILPGHFEMEVHTQEEQALAIIDGQDIYTFAKGDTITIKLAKERATLIHDERYNYFAVLKEKLGWGD